jgi:outer membrane protein insertion porin family
MICGVVRARAIAACVLVGLGPRLADAEKIKEIVVEETSKTTKDTVLLIADVDVGDEFSFALLEEIRVRLVSSDLFTSVELFSEPVPGGVRITILAPEKHSWVVAPTFYNQPGNRGAGFGFAEANVWGENKKLLLYGQYATADSFFIAGYVDPSIRGTPFKWQIDTFLRREDVTEYSIPASLSDTAILPVRTSTLRYLNGGIKFGVNLFRGVSLDVRLRGAHVKFTEARLADGVTCADAVHPDDVSAEAQRCSETNRNAPEPGDEGIDVSSDWSLQIDRWANWYGIHTGFKLRASYEQAEPALGSDFDYWYAGLSGQRGSRGHLLANDNLIVKIGVGFGADIPFQHEYTSGGVGLRGFRNREFRGDFKAKSTVEYSIPMVTIGSLSFRALAFYDTAYTDYLDREIAADTFRRYLPDPASRLGPWRNGFGGGVRVYFRSIVIPLLGFDVGYGLPGGETRTYFAIGLTEL